MESERRVEREGSDFVRVSDFNEMAEELRVEAENALAKFDPSSLFAFGPAALGPIFFAAGAGAAITHQVESFTFKNAEGVTVDNLEVTFDAGRVKTKDLGPFQKAVTEGKMITLSKGKVEDGGTAKITFEKDTNGGFEIASWRWTKGNKPQGEKKIGPPETPETPPE